MRNLLLPICPIPQSSWGYSLANKLEPEKWEKIKKRVFKYAGYLCEVCGSPENLNCHEIWKFNDKTKTQSLTGFSCLCKVCHDCVHFGRSTQVYKKPYITKLERHFKEINKLSGEQLKSYLEDIRVLSIKRVNNIYTVRVGKYELL